MSNEGPSPFPRGYDLEILVTINCQNLKITFFRTSGPISTKLSTKHLSVKDVKLYTMKGRTFFQEEIITKWRKIKNHHYRTTGPISTKLFISHPMCEEDLSLLKWKGYTFSHREILTKLQRCIHET